MAAAPFPGVGSTSMWWGKVRYCGGRGGSPSPFCESHTPPTPRTAHPHQNAHVSSVLVASKDSRRIALCRAVSLFLPLPSERVLSASDGQESDARVNFTVAGRLLWKLESRERYCIKRAREIEKEGKRKREGELN